MDDVVIYHNPRCGTSRNVLAMIRASGVEPHVVDYLAAPPSRAMIAALIARMGIRAHDLLRVKGTSAQALGLTDAGIGEVEIIDAMATEPILINRPIVVSPRGVRLCRPSEAVLDLLDRPLPPDFVKEDGTSVGPPAR